jgi:hypothetical protein
MVEDDPVGARSAKQLKVSLHPVNSTLLSAGLSGGLRLGVARQR